MYRIGHQAPSYIGPEIEAFYVEETGMNYAVFTSEADSGYVLAADHEDVGLVTYYDATEAEIAELQAKGI